MKRLILVSLLCASVGCDELLELLDDELFNPTTGRVSGQVNVFQTGFSAGIVGLVPVVPSPEIASEIGSIRSLLNVGAMRPPLRYPAVTVVRPGEIILRADAEVSADDLLKLAQVDGLEAEHGGFATRTMHLVHYRENGVVLTDAQTVALTERLGTRPGIRWASTNDVVYPTAVPNDASYAVQWHYPSMSLPAAWDVTQGASSVVVAVLDTGRTQHPDLDPRTVAGIDMISDKAVAGDGNGRDDDETDEGGDSPGGRSSWHGTHVAGTIGAASNNKTGVAGVDWNARIQHVRVLGRGGGSSFDIAAGIEWASGGDVPGVRKNATPASVINMSLGGTGSASPVYQEPIDEAVKRGTVVVIAAGNEDANTKTARPCNQDRVICVGATRHSGRRTSYSNYGAQVDVMAPGGESREDANGDGKPDGILSTYQNTAGKPTFEFLQGTSMATPHVAGLVALMKSVKSDLTPADAERILKETANAGSKCNEGCGAGLVNAYAAVIAARGPVGTETGPAKLTLATRELALTSGSSGALGVTNTGAERLDVEVAAVGDNAPRLTFPSGQTLKLAPGMSGSFTIDASFEGLAVGSHPAQISISSNGGQATVNVRLQVKGGSRPNGVVGLLYLDEAGEWQVAAEGLIRGADDYAWSLDAPAGTYYVFAGIDSNGNDELDDNEPFGMYRSLSDPQEITVVVGEHQKAVQFTVAPTASVGDGDNTGVPVGAACTRNADCGTGGVCETESPNGYCSMDCGSTPCPGGSACYGDASEQWCLATCSGPGKGRADCRPGYVCHDDHAGGAACLPACRDADDCDVGEICTASGYCAR